MTTTALAPRAPAMAMGSLSDPKELGTVLAASGYFDDARQAAQAVVKVLAGAELGFGPIASMTSVYIVKGRVTLSANLMAAQIKRWKPRYDYKVRDLTNQHAVIAFFEDGEEVGTSEFTTEDAKTAKLLGGDSWQKYPRNMLFARAMSNGAKFYCPEVFAGAPIYTPDELGAEIDPETGEIVNPDAIGAVPVTYPAGPKREDVSTMARASAPPVEVVQPEPEPADAGNSAAGESPSPVAPPEPDAPVEDPTRPVTDDELAKLTEYLDALHAPESFRTMAVMAFGAPDFASLTVGQARDVMGQAKTRAESWKAATP